MKNLFRKQFNRLLHKTVLNLHHQINIGLNANQMHQNIYSDEIIANIKNAHFDTPILSHRDVTDYGPTGFVADPFLYYNKRDSNYHLFFEVFSPSVTPTASIGHAVSEYPESNWIYDGIVFRTNRHVSFPFLFSNDGQVYVLPDLANNKDEYAPARLYKVTDFPGKWEPVADIVDTDHQCLDTVVFKYNGLWWGIMGSGDNNEIRVYFSDTLTTPKWTSHPKNPVVTDRSEAGRPAGRPVILNNSILIFFQDSRQEYGNAVNAYEIVQLNETGYKDKKLEGNPILSGTGGLSWNSGRMHHIDAQIINENLLIAVDGDIGWGRNQYTGSLWSIGLHSINSNTDAQ